MKYHVQEAYSLGILWYRRFNHDCWNSLCEELLIQPQMHFMAHVGICSSVPLPASWLKYPPLPKIKGGAQFSRLYLGLSFYILFFLDHIWQHDHWLNPANFSIAIKGRRKSPLDTKKAMRGAWTKPMCNKVFTIKGNWARLGNKVGWIEPNTQWGYEMSLKDGHLPLAQKALIK